MPMPTYLYHATRKENAESIARNGLEPRSGGGATPRYLCMSGEENGAVTLHSQASDIIFRVCSAELTPACWKKEGAGKEEWRGTQIIAAAKLEYRRNLGTPSQLQWRPASQLRKA